MRRLLSILLLLGLALGPAFEAIPAHALASGWTGKVDESAIPLCCRKNGKHHCTMAAPAGEINRTVLASSEHCPCCPQGAAATVPGNSSFAAEQAVLLPPIGKGLLTSWVENSGPLAARELTQSDRGPPASFLN